jgi:DNA-binding NarL/FixJ family response regulator
MLKHQPSEPYVLLSAGKLYIKLEWLPTLSRVTSTGFVQDEVKRPFTLDPLTEREKEILQEMAYGLRNDQIAQKLMITEGTVKSHVHRILPKFECEDRTQNVVMALRNGMVD